MLFVLAEATLGKDTAEAGHAAFEAMVTASRAEEGCLGYSYAIDVLDPTKFYAIEKWVDQAALDYHFATPHMAAFQAALRDLDITITHLAKYEADDGSSLS